MYGVKGFLGLFRVLLLLVSSFNSLLYLSLSKWNVRFIAKKMDDLTLFGGLLVTLFLLLGEPLPQLSNLFNDLGDLNPGVLAHDLVALLYMYV